MQIGLGAHSDQKGKAEDDKEPCKSHTDKIIEPGEDLVLPTSQNVEQSKKGGNAQIDQELHPRRPGTGPLRVEHQLDAEHKVGHESDLRGRKGPPAERVDPRAEVRAETSRGRVPQPEDPVRLAQGGGHAAAEFAEGDGDTDVTDGHEDEAPEDADRSASRQAAGQVLGLGKMIKVSCSCFLWIFLFVCLLQASRRDTHTWANVDHVPSTQNASARILHKSNLRDSACPWPNAARSTSSMSSWSTASASTALEMRSSDPMALSLSLSLALSLSQDV